MRQRGSWPFLVLILASPASIIAQPVEAAPSPCATLESCVDALISESVTGRQASDLVRERLKSFGAPSVDALVPLLLHPNLYVRESAGLALTEFEHIDPRHLPALAYAWRYGDTINHQGRGNGWLPRPIAATGTDEALRLLWQDFQREPDDSSNSQIFFALRDMGERVRPLLLERFASCRASGSGSDCRGNYELLREMQPPFPAWSVDAIVDLARNARSEDARWGAIWELVQLTHPAGLAPIQRQLESLPADAALTHDSTWDVRNLIGAIGRYGEAGRASGPSIARYLDRRYEEDLRADAALALGQVQDASSIPALLATAPDLSDDWLLAYNVAESLGRLRAVEGRPLLERLAAEHWHRGVRNNAARGLNAVTGGAFARPDFSGDTAPYATERDERGQEILYFGHLRYAGDDDARWCRPDEEGESSILALDPVGAIRWPGHGWRDIEFGAVDADTSAEVRQHIPITQVQGYVTASLPTRFGDLVAFNGGEFGGGLFYVPDRGSARALFEEPVAFAWQMSGKLYVAAGLAHLFLDLGHIYVIDPARLRIERVIRLPASPRRMSVSDRRAVIVQTGEGDIAIGERGRLFDPERLGDCEDE